MYGISRDRGRFMMTFRLDTICNITQETQELQKFQLCLSVHWRGCDKIS